MTLTKTLATVAVGAALLPAQALAQVDPIQPAAPAAPAAGAATTAAAPAAEANQLADVKNVQATAGEASITLSWDAVPGADSYTVYYDTVSVGSTSQSYKNETTAKEPKITLDKLTAGTKYYFAVAAEDSTGKKLGSANFSTEVSATPTEPLHGAAGVASSSDVADSLSALEDKSPAVTEPAGSTGSEPAPVAAETSSEPKPANLPKSGPEVALLGLAAAGFAAVRRRFFTA